MTKTELKRKIDAIYAEIDLHTDLTPKQRAQVRRETAEAIRTALGSVHSAVPGMTKPHRIKNANVQTRTIRERSIGNQNLPGIYGGDSSAD